MAIEPGLDHLPDGKLDDEEQTHRPEQHRPPGIDGECDDRRKCGSDDRADIRDETQQRPEDAPEYRIGHADEPQPGPDQHAKARVDRGLRQEIAAQAAGGIIERYGCAPKISRAGEPDKAVSQIFPLQQEEDHENHDDAGRREWLKQGCRDLLEEQERRRMGLADLDRHRVLRLVVARESGGFIATLPAPFSSGFSISLLRLLSIAEVRSTMPPLVVVSRSEWIFWAMLVWYPGSSPARCASWLPTKTPMPTIIRKASTTTRITEGTRPKCQRRSSSTGGAERKTQKDRQGHRNKHFPPEIERGNGNDPDGQSPKAGRRNTRGVDLPVRGSHGVGHRRASWLKTSGHQLARRVHSALSPYVLDMIDAGAAGSSAKPSHPGCARLPTLPPARISLVKGVVDGHRWMGTCRFR